MSINRGIDKDVIHIYNGIHSAIKTYEIMPFAATWRDLRNRPTDREIKFMVTKAERWIH